VRLIRSALMIAACPISLGGCTCSENGSERGHPDAEPPGYTDADSDADSDSDTDTCLGEDYHEETPFEPEWQPLPEGWKNCGQGCRMLTFTANLLRFDVWDDKVIAEENPTGSGGVYITLANVKESRYAFLESGSFSDGSIVFQPTICEKDAAYLWWNGHELPEWGVRYKYFDGEKKVAELLDSCNGSVYGLDCSPQHCAYVMRRTNHNPGMQDLFVYDREASEVKQVTDFGGVIAASISGEWVTFTAMYIGGADVFAYNVESEQLLNISDHPSAQFNSRGDGPRIVWTDLRNNPDGSYGGNYADADIYYYDIETDELRQITSGNGIQLYPDINGDRIVWQDYRDCPNPNDPYAGYCLKVWGYDLQTDEERPISHVPGGSARVWGDEVYFQSGKFLLAQRIEPEQPDGGPDVDTDVDTDTDTDPLDCAGGRLDEAGGLCWQHPNSCCHEWQEARDYCESLELAGHDDWYLPSREEIVGLLGGCDSDVAAGQAGFCDPCSESGTCSGLFGADLNAYWSSSQEVPGSDQAWSFYFDTGTVAQWYTQCAMVVRCVRPAGP
jgi:beta propeller repeat protein